MNEEYQQKINGYKEDIQQNIDQEAVLQTIKNCKKTFVQAEDYPLSYMEFIYDQMQFIQKRWWILQGCLLAVLWIFLNDAADIYEMQRLMGAGACLFAIFLVPEILEKSKKSGDGNRRGSILFAAAGMHGANSAVWIYGSFDRNSICGKCGIYGESISADVCCEFYDSI